MNSAVIFGAGNIGRSFIGNIFTSNRWEVTFIDANRQLVDRLCSRGSYPILIKRSGQADETVIVSGISALHSSDTDKIAEKLTACTICCTSVGQGALPFVVPVIAEAVKSRAAAGRPPLDVIIAENIRNGADYFREIFRKNKLIGDEAGLIETSIGKMVPIMRESELAEDPLVLHAEEYNTLILDGKGFKGSVPDFPQIKAVSNIKAWVDRKLFIHNLGHAAAAYFGYESFPERRLIAEVINDSEVLEKVKEAMKESASALLSEYPQDFTRQDLDDHIDDLLFRFGNKALGDTVFRVGRDLNRKLGRDDRVLGAAALCIKHSLPCDRIIDAFHSALRFKATDEEGNMYDGDINFRKITAENDIKTILINDLGVKTSEEVLINLVTTAKSTN